MRTKLKAFVLVLIVAYGSITIVHSQESAGFISSPEGMSTVGAIQSPITNTGAINVQIPLYTVSSGSIHKIFYPKEDDYNYVLRNRIR